MTARALARAVLARVDDGAYATLALGGELARARSLSQADRALATELVYGVLKWRLRLDHALAACAPRGLASLDDRTRNVLRMAAYQILFLRIPAHAAVDDAVSEIKRSRSAKLGGFANALLRRLAREGEAPLSPDLSERDALSLGESAPTWLVDGALRRLPSDETREFLHALNLPAPLWLRVNRLRTTREDLATALSQEIPTLRLQPSSVLPEALRAEAGGDLSRSAPFVDGKFTIQDLAAQRVAHLLDAAPDQQILDACSGVGGKATHLAELTEDRAAIDAADLSERKLERCADSARRLGLKSIRAIACDLSLGESRDRLRPSYDRVLLDAPCSGLGVLRRHPELKWRRTSSDVGDLVRLQSELLDALSPRVSPGGLLVYSVCTFTEEEGPHQIARFIEAHSQFQIEGEPLMTWPHRDDCDAFFAVRLRRLG